MRCQPDHAKDQAVADLIAADPRISVREISAAMGLKSGFSIQKRLARLRAAGVLEIKKFERHVKTQPINEK
jgi:SOS-response transcriptional repressor LexA